MGLCDIYEKLGFRRICLIVTLVFVFMTVFVVPKNQVKHPVVLAGTIRVSNGKQAVTSRRVSRIHRVVVILVCKLLHDWFPTANVTVF